MSIRKLLLGACMMSTVACGAASHATAQYADSVERVVFAGNLDFDSIADTVLALRRGMSGYLPTSIRWGTTTGGQQHTTRFQFPAWSKIKGSTSFIRLNEDSLTDIVMFFWGKVPGSQPLRDTGRAVVIFAQSQLKNVNQINVHQLASSQNSPFFSIDLVEGTHLLDRRARDYSGRPSWILQKVQLDVADTAEAPLPNIVAAAASGRKATLWPNPAASTAYLDLDGFDPGEYRAQFVATNGAILRQTTIRVSNGRSHRLQLDLSELPSAAYELRIIRGEALKISLRIVVAH